jgi:hypothetical protein
MAKRRKIARRRCKRRQRGLVADMMAAYKIGGRGAKRQTPRTNRGV